MLTCDICHTSSEEKPLTVYADLELENFVHLCPDCRKRILSRTGGSSP